MTKADMIFFAITGGVTVLGSITIIISMIIYIWRLNNDR